MTNIWVATPPGVPYAIHDARVFKEYCEKTLGIPVENIHLVEDGTKAMISEEEFQWLKSINNREMKKLIVYYAGHGVPDIHDSNKAYLLPTEAQSRRTASPSTTSMQASATLTSTRLPSSSTPASAASTVTMKA